MSPVRRATRRTFSSLSVRNYRLFFWAQLVSVSGTWMQWVAQGWLVLKLTDSGVALGIATALQFLPTFAGGLWGGVVADRFDKRRILIVTQSLAGVLALILGAVTAIGVVQLWMVYVLAFLSGCVMVIDTPARQAFVGEMVGVEALPNAVALNAAVFNSGRIIGPAIAAALISTAGLAPAFLINGVSYVAVVIALRAMDTRALQRPERAPRAAGQVREGLRFVWADPELRTVLALVAAVATFGMNFTVILPLMAKYTFHGGAGVYGFLSSVMAGGALAGALLAAMRRRPSFRLLAWGAAVFGLSTVAAAAAPGIGVEAAILVVVGMASMVLVAQANSMVQLGSPGPIRGRVTALYSLVFLGGTAVGGPIAGWISQTYGARAGLALGGSISLVAAVAALARPKPVAVLEPQPEPAALPA